MAIFLYKQVVFHFYDYFRRGIPMYSRPHPTMQAVQALKEAINSVFAD